jgi:adenylate cyclase class 2
VKTGDAREEVEVKLVAPGVEHAREQLSAAGFQVSAPRVFEENIVLDTPASSLRRDGLLLRVRRAGGTVTCTFKGHEIPGPHKRREEREFRASDFEEALALFKGLGFRPSFRYEKYRTEFSRAAEPGHATLDETPIGVFLELEGDARWIDRTAKELGFSRDAYILESYGGLYARWREANPGAPPDMIFPPASKSRRRR